MVHVSNSSSWNAFWTNKTLIAVTENADKVCEFFQSIQLYSLLGHSCINGYNELRNKEILLPLNNILGKSQLIDALGIFQLLGNIRRLNENQSVFASVSEMASMAADVLYFPVALQELNLICLGNYARQLGKVSLLKWVPNQSADIWVNSCLLYKYLFQIIFNFEKLLKLIRKEDFYDTKNKGELKAIILSGAVGFTEAAYYASTLLACKQKTMDRWMFIAKLTGVISVSLISETV